MVNVIPHGFAGSSSTGVGRQILHVAHRGVGDLLAGSVVGLALAVRWRWRTIPVPARGLGSVPTIAGVFMIGQAGLGTADVLSSVTVRSPIVHLTVAGRPWACVVLLAVLGLVPMMTAGSGPSSGGRTEPTPDARTRRSCSERASG